MSRAIVLAAPAKVNLSLEIVGRRADGYHELVSIFATVDLADRVRVAVGGSLDVRIRPDVDAPEGEDLGTRAVRALAAATGRAAAAHVRIRKRIPVASGLGGGSSDAGAVLCALARLWRVDTDLGPVAATVGSDVPFFVAGAPYALVRGRGESVAAIPSPALPLWLVLVRVRARVSTPAVFAALRQDDWTDGAETTGLATSFVAGTIDPARLRAASRNGLLAAAERVCPAIAEVRAAALARGVELALSGSGPTLYRIADDRADALRVSRQLRRIGLDARPYVLGVALSAKRASAVPLR
ncbi:MAG TPA: 4-(cytidine 5'-diphospho)-2-C-methyl-D-erythritol kinase [Candidatus Saccharimonadales bacterium]|nr:4-(cytidine 5'-diphospho)-2-C-methyl-D-erythritol kinase [Candidatus Saccharimonadales bacterium]